MSDIALFIINFGCVVYALISGIFALDKAYNEKKKLTETDFWVLIALVFASFLYFMWYDFWFWIPKLLE